MILCFLINVQCKMPVVYIRIYELQSINEEMPINYVQWKQIHTVQDSYKKADMHDVIHRILIVCTTLTTTMCILLHITTAPTTVCLQLNLRCFFFHPVKEVIVHSFLTHAFIFNCSGLIVLLIFEVSDKKKYCLKSK